MGRRLSNYERRKRAREVLELQRKKAALRERERERRRREQERERAQIRRERASARPKARPGDVIVLPPGTCAGGFRVGKP